MYARQNDLALEQARKTFDLEPSHITARVWLANVYESLGMYSEAIALSEESLKDHLSDQYFLLYSGTRMRKQADERRQRMRYRNYVILKKPNEAWLWIVATEIETSILPHTTDAAMSRSTGPTTVLPAQQSRCEAGGHGRPNVIRT
jgi:hypothetical protein